ncbi:acyl-CoA dehydrogenase family protein [Pusillimonas sp. SM2304]|uniref:acyl-CoA dehydrogenase family protein n=1 Tax=Pusillimonas sp. SM2304 TaxID=3073241 RepID=UPI0028749776|nr:acyl-CoA dehydrogenase family protein [Pusillimonas sp. SM2304]MDS1139487.1 acyl-CoA dehydrogenase family protein [Pusillimonas sp. SM2304]
MRTLKELKERVRRFIDDVAIPLESLDIERDVDALDDIARTLRRQAREAGIYGPQLPREYGGLALPWLACAELFEESARSLLGPIALNCAPPDQPNALLLDLLASPAQRAQFLEPIARSEKRACFAMTEPAPGAGSDPSMLQTTARRKHGKWVLNGHKKFISGGIKADIAIVPARTEEGVTLFVFETATPGYRVVRDIPMVTGYQIGGHAEILLEDCELADDAVLGVVGKGLAHIQLRLEPARLSHCMRFIGRARRAMDIAQGYVNERVSFGARLAEQQQVQAMVADSHIDLHASRLLTLHCAALMDEGKSVKHHSSMAKVFVSEAVGRVADRAMQMCGALGISEDAAISAIWREMRPFRIYDGANEVHRSALARRILDRNISP